MKRMHKNVLTLLCRALAALMLVTLLPFAAFAEEAPARLRVATLKGPTGMAMARLMEEYADEYDFTVAGAPEELTGLIVNGSVDIAAVPSNLGAVLYNKTGGQVKLLSIIARSMLYVLEKGDTIQSPADLAGKTIVTSGQGSLPEYVLNYVLSQYQVENVTVDYKAEHTEVITLAAAGQADVVIVPEPHVTSLLTKDPSFRVALNLGDCFDEAAAAAGYAEAKLSMSAVVVRTDALENQTDAVRAFLTRLEDSVAYAADPETMEACAQAVADQGILPSAQVALKALPNCNLTFVAGADMQPQLMPLYQVLFDANPAAVGGKLPGDDYFATLD